MTGSTRKGSYKLSFQLFQLLLGYAYNKCSGECKHAVNENKDLNKETNKHDILGHNKNMHIKTTSIAQETMAKNTVSLLKLNKL